MFNKWYNIIRRLNLKKMSLMEEEIFSNLIKKARGKKVLAKLYKIEEELREEHAEAEWKRSSNTGSRFVREISVQDVSKLEEKETQNKEAADKGAEIETVTHPELQLVQDLLFSDGEVDIEKLLCLHLLAKRSFIDRIYGKATSTYGLINLQPVVTPQPETMPEPTNLSQERGINLSNISFLNTTAVCYSCEESPELSVVPRRLSSQDQQRHSTDSLTSCRRIQDGLEQLVDTAMEMLREFNPDKLRVMLQVENDPRALREVLAKKKVRHFLRQVCGKEMVATNSCLLRPVMRRDSTKLALRWPAAPKQRKRRSISLKEAEQRLRDAGIEVDYLIEIENMLDKLTEKKEEPIKRGRTRGEKRRPSPPQVEQRDLTEVKAYPELKEPKSITLLERLKSSLEADITGFQFKVREDIRSAEKLRGSSSSSLTTERPTSHTGSLLKMERKRISQSHKFTQQRRRVVNVNLKPFKDSLYPGLKMKHPGVFGRKVGSETSSSNEIQLQGSFRSGNSKLFISPNDPRRFTTYNETDARLAVFLRAINP